MQADIYAYIMSASPPKEADVEQGDPTPENSEPMDRGDTEPGARELAYNEFDVKEQDRWLPIANGWLLNALSYRPSTLRSVTGVVKRAMGKRICVVRQALLVLRVVGREVTLQAVRLSAVLHFLESPKSAHSKALVVPLPRPIALV